MSEVKTEKVLTTKEVEGEIDAFFQDTQIGSAKLLALSDFLIYDELIDHVYYYVQAEDDPDPLENKSENASDLRMAEFKLVIVEELIRQREVTIPLYYPYYTRIKQLKDRFIEAYIHEERKLYPKPNFDIDLKFEGDEAGWEILKNHYQAILSNQNLQL